MIIELSWSALRNRGPSSELSAKFLVRHESGVAAVLARFWPVFVRVGVRVRVRVRVKVRVMGWVGSTPGARTLTAPERCNT